MSRSCTLGVVILAMVFGGVVPQAQAASLGKRPLGPGMNGHDVRVLQDFLTRLGLVTNVDGEYGPGTEVRVRAWERRSDTTVDGRVSRAEVRTMRRQLKTGVRMQLAAAPSAPAEAPAPAEERPDVAPAPAAGSDEAAPAATTGTSAKATIGSDGMAIAPAAAPDAVKRIIAAGNQIHDKPYRYGGGHGSWVDSGYDCSGSLSYALRGAKLVESPLNSSGFLSWGEAGEGDWVTLYTNPGHAYMVVAGLRFDTSGARASGSRWQTEERSARGFTSRHPRGL